MPSTLFIFTVSLAQTRFTRNMSSKQHSFLKLVLRKKLSLYKMTHSLVAKPVISSSLKMLIDWIDCVSGEVVKSKQMCYQSMADIVNITLNIFPVFIHQPGNDSYGKERLVDSKFSFHFSCTYIVQSPLWYYLFICSCYKET